MATETAASELQQPSRNSQPTLGSNASGGSQDEISILGLILILARKRRVIFWVTGICVAVSIAIAFLLPKEFTAEVTLLPPQQGSSLAGALGSQLGSLGALAQLAGGGLGIKNPNDMYVAMLKSTTVEDGMVRHFNLMQEYHDKLLSRARKDLENHATIKGNGKDGLIHISIEDRNPRRAAELANGYVAQYRDLSQHLAISEAGQRALFFRNQLKQAKDKLADAEESMEKMEIASGVIEPHSQAAALIDTGISLRGQIVAKEVEIQALQTFAGSQNTQLIQAQEELKGLQAQLAKLTGSTGNADSLIIPKGMVPQASLEYIRRERDVKYYETIFEVLARQYELAKLDQAKEGALIQVVDPAIVPDHKSSPHRLLIIVVGTLVGFFLAILIALTRAGWESIEQDPEAGSTIAAIRSEFHRPRRQHSER